MTDRMTTALERYTDIKLEWGLSGAPEDVDARLTAVVRWLDTAAQDPAVPLRATQILLLDPELPEARRRPVVKRAHKALGGTWASSGADTLHLLQAMILAGRPEERSESFELVGLLRAGWELMRGRERFHQTVEPWLEFRAGVVAETDHSIVLCAMPKTLGKLGNESGVSDKKKAAFAALSFLRSNSSSGWNYSGFSEKLLCILAYLNESAIRLAAQRPNQSNQLSSAAPHLRQLEGWRSDGLSYNSFSGPLIAWMEAVIQLLTDLSSELPGLFPGWHSLRAQRGSGWTFEYLSPHLLPVLDALLHGVAQLEDRERLSSTVQSVDAALQQQSAQIQTTLSALSTRLPDALASARPPELELLWWGEARYCHTYREPFRRMLKDPTERTRALYAAIAEASTRAWRLDPEPSAAYLVAVLADFGFDIDSARPLSDWMRELATHPPKDDAPTGALAALASDDPVGLPVTWARQHPGFTLDDDRLSNALAMPVNEEIDLGTWATWILRERVLEARLRS